ncbi:MAG: dihydrodipicolinate reductase [Frankiales bacterium]|nr:MAG: dihydrodipicolinate reductase [Frankiales bacterium]
MSLRTVVWGTGNLGRAAVRAVQAHPGLELAAVLTSTPAKVGRDAGDISDVEPLGVVLTDDVEGVLGARPDAVVYAASGDLRPDDAAADIRRALAAGAVVVTPSLYAMYDPRSAPAELRDPLEKACAEGGSALLVSGIDPGWANDVLPVLLSGLSGTLDQVRCQELFDYSTYDQPDAVRGSVGMGGPMDQVPLMVLPGVPAMIWGGQVRLVARALGIELDEVVERVERRPLERDVDNAMGRFDKGSQGGLRFEVAGVAGGRDVVVVEHVTRIAPDVAPDWPSPADGGAGAHRVVLEGRPRIEVTIEAEDEGGNRAAGGNATAVNRLVAAIPWLREAAPGVYDALQVPLSPAVGRLGRG